MVKRIKQLNVVNGSATVTYNIGDINAINITYSNLCSLRNNNGLIPGTFYRITDYTTIISQTNTQSANHAFDIIVRADAANKLNENAYAALHSGDTYFASSKLESWQLKYCLDNDTNRFAWASSSGKGVVYWMKDEWDNECPYDFKNIRFTIGSDTNAGIANGKYYFTFSSVSGTSDSTINDLSLNGTRCYGNKIATSYENGVISLYANIFRNTSSSNVHCCHNTIKAGSYSNRFNNGCQYNILDKGCFSNSFSASCVYNIFGDICHSNTLNSSCEKNTFGNFCRNNSFGTSCRNNIIGNESYSNTLGASCNRNKMAANCFSNTLGSSCNDNTLNVGCYSNTIGNNSFGTTLGAGCYNNILGQSNSNNLFGSFCGNINFGNNCHTIIIETRCTNIIFGSSTSSLKTNIRNIKVEAGNQNIYLNCSATTSTAAYFQNVTLVQGANTTTSYKTITHTTAGDNFKTTYQNASSTTKNV